MTVIEKLNPKIQYNGPIAINDALSINFPYTDTEDVKCVANNKQLVYNRDYTVLDQTLTIKIAIPKGQTITIYRSTPLDQQAEFPQNNRFNSAKLNASLDKICMQQQEQNEKITRSVKVPIDTNVSFEGSLPTPIPNRILRINDKASGFEFVPYDLDERLDTFENTVVDNIAAGQEAIENSFEEFKNETNITINNINTKASNAETTANSANIKSENAVNTANTAASTSNNAFNTSNEARVIAQNAVNTANTAVSTATTALNTSNEAKVIAQNAVDISNDAVTTANTTVTRVDTFEDNITAVIEAADKINSLEEGIEQATNAADIAQEAANTATNAANEAITTLNTKANQDLSNLSTTGQSKFDAKANKATTLAGYGISDAYTKTQSDTLLDTKVNVSDMVQPPFVNKNGDTMTGRLLFNNFTSSTALETKTAEVNKNTVISQNTAYDNTLTTAPSSHTYINRYRGLDKNAKEVGCLEMLHDTANNVRTIVRANRIVSGATKTVQLDMGVRTTGSRYFNINADEILVNSKAMPYVTEQVVSGTSWYRVWSNGLIEQGGESVYPSTITFLKPFTSTGYTLTYALVGETNAGYDAVVMYNKTTTSVAVKQLVTNVTGVVGWYASGK